MSAFCPRENSEKIFFFIKLLIRMLVQWCRTRSWFQKVHSEDDFFVSNKRIVFFKPLFLLTKLKSRHAERTQFEGYSVAKGRVSLLKASSGYPVFKMHLLKVAKVNILCLSCTENLLQSEQPKCTQLCSCSCSGAIALKHTNAPFFLCVKLSECNMMHCKPFFGWNISIPNTKVKRLSLIKRKVNISNIIYVIYCHSLYSMTISCWLLAMFVLPTKPPLTFVSSFR